VLKKFIITGRHISSLQKEEVRNLYKCYVFKKFSLLHDKQPISHTGFKPTVFYCQQYHKQTIETNQLNNSKNCNRINSVDGGRRSYDEVFLIGGTGRVSTSGLMTGTWRSTSSAALLDGALRCILIGFRPCCSALHSSSVS